MQASVQGELEEIGGIARSDGILVVAIRAMGVDDRLGAGAGRGDGRLLAGAGDGVGRVGRRPAGDVGYAAAVVIGGIELFPQAARNLLRFHLDIDVLMGLAVLGAMALGQWDEAATVAFLYGLSEALEALSLERARRSIRALLDLSPPDRPSGSVPTGRSRSCRPAGCERATACWCAPATRSRSTARSPRAGRAWIRRRSRASRCRWSAGRATRCTPGRSTARGRWRSGPRGRWGMR